MLEACQNLLLLVPSRTSLCLMTISKKYGLAARVTSEYIVYTGKSICNLKLAFRVELELIDGCRLHIV